MYVVEFQSLLLFSPFFLDFRILYILGREKCGFPEAVQSELEAGSPWESFRCLCVKLKACFSVSGVHPAFFIGSLARLRKENLSELLPFVYELTIQRWYDF